tara:strand:- start:2216 stop:3667 length:1452 start_codon:yes stop_codon:yes gene_type:complete
MLRKILSLLILATCLIYSQNEIDALRYSLCDNYTTARTTALGGSFSALGGNIGGIYSNPATLATYRTNEFSISIINDDKTIQTHYLNNNTTSNRHKLTLQNIGYIQTINLVNEGGWNRINYAFSYNKKTDLNSFMSISGHNPNSSMSSVFLNNSQGLTPDELNSFSDYLAFWTYLIDTVPNFNGDGPNTEYTSNVNNIGQNQHMTIIEEGSIEDYDISISGAYDDFLFLGGSMTISGISFSQYNRYEETDFEQTKNEIESFSYNHDLHVSGVGLNWKIGAIVKPAHFFRIGLAHHSKTYLDLEETYKTNMHTYFNNNENFSANSPTNYFEYELITPAKSIGSIAFVIAKKGLITFDYETINYGNSNLYSHIYNFNQENNNISNYYTRTNNKKIGLEWKIKNISFRGGYATFGSPFQDNLNDGSKKYFSGGIGFQKKAYFIDLAIINCLTKEDYILYRDHNTGAQLANTETNRQTLIITCSYKF